MFFLVTALSSLDLDEGMVDAQARRPLSNEIPKQRGDTGQGAVTGACDAAVGEVSLGSPSVTAHCCTIPKKDDGVERFQEPGGERQRGRRRPRDQQVRRSVRYDSRQDTLIRCCAQNRTQQSQEQKSCSSFLFERANTPSYCRRNVLKGSLCEY